MKTEIQLNKFKRAVSLVERAAGKHPTLPVLSCILLESSKDGLLFKATNLDVGIEVSVPAKARPEWALAVPAKTIAAFLSNIQEKDGVAAVEATPDTLQISFKGAKVTIKAMPHEDFPVIPEAEGKAAVSMPAESLIKGFKSVWYASSVSGIKPELSSVYVRTEGGNAVFASTDSFRLAEKRVRLPKTASIEDMLVPFRNVSDIMRVLESSSGDVTVKAGKNLVSFETDGVRAVSRLVDGVFPDYKQIMPKGFVTEAVVLKQDIVNAVKTTNIFSDAFNQLRVSADPKAGLFILETKNADVGESRTALSAAVTGEAVEANFNGKYVSDCFQSMDSDSVSLQFNGRNKPMVMRPVSGEQTFTYLVMPMNR